MTTTTILTMLTAILGPLLGFLGGLYANRVKARDDSRDNDREDAAANDARWQAMLDNQRKDFELLLAPMRADLESVRREVAELRTLYDRIRSLYRTACDYIRTLRARWPVGDPVPEIPTELIDEV